MRRYLQLIIAITWIVCLSGCFMPEKFTAEVNVANDGSYTYVFDGRTAHILAIMSMTGSGKGSNDKLEKDLKDHLNKLSKSPDMQKVTYIGNGRYEMRIAGKRKAGQAIKVLDAFRVFTDKNGVIHITSTVLKPSDKAELKKLGINIDGKLSVTLPKNADVISSNATSSPSFFGMFGTYSWKIGSHDVAPTMKIMLR